MTSFSGNVVVGKIHSNYKYVGVLITVSILAMILCNFFACTKISGFQVKSTTIG